LEQAGVVKGCKNLADDSSLSLGHYFTSWTHLIWEQEIALIAAPRGGYDVERIEAVDDNAVHLY
jgi:hypothetical protein